MIDLYYHTTPNTRKVLMMLEEVKADYRLIWLDITTGAQFGEDFLAISPNAKVPAILDHDGPEGAPFTLFESGAILVYLAEKFSRLLPTAPRARLTVLAWVFWQVGGQGPSGGQGAHFWSHAPAAGIDIPYAKERFVNDAKRHYAVLDRRLEGREFLVDDFSIADIAAFPWTRVAKGHGVDIEAYPNVRRWSDAIAARPSAKVRPRAPDATDQQDGFTPYDARQRAVLFGAGQASLGG